MASAVYQNGMLRITLPRRLTENTSPGESRQEQSSQSDEADPGAGELADSLPAGLPVVTEPASGRLTYTSLKETSHA